MRHPSLLLTLIAVLFALSGASPAMAAETRQKARASETKAKSAAKIDLNTADNTLLQTLPGVGPATAREIIAARPFSSVDDLEKVPGIGPARLAEIRDHVTISRPRAEEKKTERAAKSGTPSSPSVPAKSEKKAAADTANKRTESTSATTASKRGETTPASTAKSERPRATTGKVDLNTADRAALETLPGVGPVIAQAIVANRPYQSVDDLSRVPGLGVARIEELRDQVTVSPQRASSSNSPSARALSPTGRININTASLEELEALPDIGPVKAQAIIDARPFATVEDIMRVKGIKEGTFEAVRDYIRVR